MGIYKNDYQKKEDSMLWELHRIRHTLAKKKENALEINQQGMDIIKKYHLKNVILVNDL